MWIWVTQKNRIRIQIRNTAKNYTEYNCNKIFYDFSFVRQWKALKKKTKKLETDIWCSEPVVWGSETLMWGSEPLMWGSEVSFANNGVRRSEIGAHGRWALPLSQRSMCRNVESSKKWQWQPCWIISLIFSLCLLSNGPSPFWEGVALPSICPSPVRGGTTGVIYTFSWCSCFPLNVSLWRSLLLLQLGASILPWCLKQGVRR